uniref:Uncharacterized protein n=1 Tax=Arundo donax TaxID=35708 RepID=A0A0A9DUH7_ARUDO
MYTRRQFFSTSGCQAMGTASVTMGSNGITLSAPLFESVISSSRDERTIPYVLRSTWRWRGRVDISISSLKASMACVTRIGRVWICCFSSIRRNIYPMDTVVCISLPIICMGAANSICRRDVPSMRFQIGGICFRSRCCTDTRVTMRIRCISGSCRSCQNITILLCFL